MEGTHPSSLAAARTLAHIYLRLPIIADRQRDVWDAWQSAAPLCPQLYLHSAVDMLVPQQEVAAFQEVQVQPHNQLVTVNVTVLTVHCGVKIFGSVTR